MEQLPHEKRLLLVLLSMKSYLLVYKQAFEQQNYNVRATTDIAEALRILEIGWVDIVICEWKVINAIGQRLQTDAQFCAHVGLILYETRRDRIYDQDDLTSQGGSLNHSLPYWTVPKTTSGNDAQKLIETAENLYSERKSLKSCREPVLFSPHPRHTTSVAGLFDVVDQGLGGQYHDMRFGEFKDLFSIIFAPQGYTEMRIERVFWHVPGRVLLLVNGYQEKLSRLVPFLLEIGTHASIPPRSTLYLSNLIIGATKISRPPDWSTSHYTALRYELIGSLSDESMAELRSFDEVVTSHFTNSADIVAVVEQILSYPLKAPEEMGLTVTHANLIASYAAGLGLPNTLELFAAQVQQTLETLQNAPPLRRAHASEDLACIPGLFAETLAYFEDEETTPRVLESRLRLETILVHPPTGMAWLTDTHHPQPAPWFATANHLEAQLRFAAWENVDFASRAALEEKISAWAATPNSDTPSSAGPSAGVKTSPEDALLWKLSSGVQAVRAWAHSQPEYNETQYQLGMLLHAAAHLLASHQPNSQTITGYHLADGYQAAVAMRRICQQIHPQKSARAHANAVPSEGVDSAARLRLDMDKKIFLFDEDPLDLRPQAFAMLELLFKPENRGNLVTYAALHLLYNTAPYSKEINDKETIHQCISEIRQEIKRAGRLSPTALNQILQARPKMGYILHLVE